MQNAEFEKSRRFYENYVAPMIHEKFPKYESRIAIGLVGEGSDCFGYDDYMSRDHDFGTGICFALLRLRVLGGGKQLSGSHPAGRKRLGGRAHPLSAL